MATIEKEKALDVIRQMVADGQVSQEVAEKYFPELKESEGERMIKFIKEQLFNIKKTITENYELDEKLTKAIDWLEKKGQTFTKKDVDDAYLKGVCDTKQELEKQSGKKSANSYCQKNCKGFQETGKCFFDEDCKAKKEAESIDKVEPKFHEGDWVVYNNDICQIVKREEGCNKLVTVFGIEKELVNERNLSTARLWTIQDAKDGDVLVIQKKDVTYESIFIFNKIENNRIIQHLHYFTTEAGEEVCEARSIDGFLGFVEDTVHPATKKQRDALMKAMNEVGYEWSDKDRKLIKIVK